MHHGVADWRSLTQCYYVLFILPAHSVPQFRVTATSAEPSAGPALYELVLGVYDVEPPLVIADAAVETSTNLLQIYASIVDIVKARIEYNIIIHPSKNMKILC